MTRLTVTPFHSFNYTCSHTVVITDINHFKDAFVKSTDGAGRPFSDGMYSQKLLNPYYPVAGKRK